MLFLILWLWVMAYAIFASTGPNGVSMGTDFSHMYSAMLALQRGLDPYDYHVLSHVQRAVLSPSHLPVQPTSSTVLIGTSPFYLWLFQPFTLLPYQSAAAAWMASTYILSGLSFFAVLRYFGWRHHLLPTVLFLAAPQSILAGYYGNTIDLVVFGVACSLPLLARHPVVSGILLSLTILKAPAALPIALLIILFQAPHRRQVVLGLTAAFVLRNALAGLLVGQAPVVERWADGMFSFSQSIASQPNLIGLSGIYVGRLPHGQRFVVEALMIGVACALTFAWYWRWRKSPTIPFLASAWLWPLWLLATPYAHFVDEMLLAIPVVALLGRDGVRLRHPLSLATLSLVMGSIFLFSMTLDGVSLLWVPLAGVTLCFIGALPLLRTEASERANELHGTYTLIPAI